MPGGALGTREGTSYGGCQPPDKNVCYLTASNTASIFQTSSKTSFMYYRDCWRAHPFADVMTGEDNQFLFAARDKVIITSGEGYMFAGIHPGNTSPRKLDASAQYVPMEPVCA